MQPLSNLQKKAIRIITFSSFSKHSSPFFKDLNIVKLSDIITLQLALFMYKFHNQLLPSVFDAFFNPARNIHSYNTRLSCRMTYAIPKARTNYGILNIKFQGVKVRNGISDDIKLLPLKHFQNKLKALLLLIIINFKFIINIFFLAFRCLIHAHLGFWFAVWIFFFYWRVFSCVAVCLVYLTLLKKTFINNLNKATQSL